MSGLTSNKKSRLPGPAAAAGLAKILAAAGARTRDISTPERAATEQTVVSALPSIAGRITSSGGAGVTNVSMALSGSQAASTTTNGSGFYEFANLTQGGNYSVTPSRSGLVVRVRQRPSSARGGNGQPKRTGRETR